MIKSNTLLLIALFAIFLILGNYCVTEEKVNKEQQSEIAKLISQLGDNDWKAREEAQKKLEAIGMPAESAVKEAAKDKDNEISIRAERILKVIAVKKRVKFSDTFLKEFPDIYHNLAVWDSLNKFEFFKKIEDAPRDKYKDIVTNKDRVAMVGELLLNNGEDLSYEEVRFITRICSGGGQYSMLKEKWYYDDSLPGTIPHLKKLLADKDCDIRRLALESLMNMDDKKSIPEIRNLLHDKEITFKVIDALQRLGDKESAPEIRKLIDDKNKDVKCKSIIALGDFGDKESIPEIRKLIDDENESVNGIAIMALGKLGDKESIPEIRKLIGDKNHKYYHLMLKSLADLGDKDSIPKIRELMKTEDAGVFEFVIETLGKLGDKESIPEIRKLFYSNDRRVNHIDGSHGVLRVKLTMATSLARLGDKEFIPTLREIMNEYDDVHKSYRYSSEIGIVGLGELNDKTSIPQIRKFLDDNTPNNRVSAIFTLVKLGDKESIPKIRKFLKKNERYEKIVAMQALGDFGDKESTTDILKIFNDKDELWDVRCWAAITLLRLGEKLSIEESLLKDIDLLIKTDNDFAEQAKGVLKSSDIPSK